MVRHLIYILCTTSVYLPISLLFCHFPSISSNKDSVTQAASMRDEIIIYILKSGYFHTESGDMSWWWNMEIRNEGMTYIAEKHILPIKA